MLHLIADKMRDLTLLSKVHTSGLLVRHRNNEELSRGLNAKVEQKIASVVTEVANVKTASATQSQSINNRYQQLNEQQYLMQEGLMGRVELSMSPKVIEVGHALLNDADLGEVITHLIARLIHPANGKQHYWIKGEQVRVALTATIDDETIPAPSATDPVEIEDGNCHSYLTWGTGTGTYATGVAATGTITCVGGNKLVNGQTVTVKDALGVQKVFDFRSTGIAVGFNVLVPFTAQSTAAQMATALKTAIEGASLAMTVTIDDDELTLTQNYVGDIGNNAITDTVIDAGFVVSGFTGGSADKIVAKLSVESAHDLGDDKLPFGNFEIAPFEQIFVVR